MQRNWIGRSEGAEFDLVVEGRDGSDGARAAGPAGLHHPTRHLLRHDLRGGRPRAPAGRRAHHARARRGGRGPAGPGGGEHRHRAHVRVGRGQPGQAGRLHRVVGGQPLHGNRGAGLRGRLRAHGLRHRGHHGRARRGPPRTGTSPRPTACPMCARCSRPRAGTSTAGPTADPGGATRAPAGRSTARGWTASTSRRPRSGPPSGWRSRGSASARSTTGCGTGWSPASASGAAPSRSSTAPTTASCRCPRTSSPSSPPTTSSSCPTGESPLRHPSRVPEHHLPDLRRARHPRDRHHGHLRRLVLVLPALHRPVDARRPVRQGDRPPLDAGRPVHRRHRARHPAPPLRPLLHQGPGRRGPGPGGAARAVRPAVHPGHDPHGRQEDVEVQGQPGRPVQLPRPRSAPTPCACSTCSSGLRPTTSTGRPRPTRSSRAAPATSTGCGGWPCPRCPGRPATRR